MTTTDDTVARVLDLLPRARPDALAHLTGESPRYILGPAQVRDLLDQLTAAVVNLRDGREQIGRDLIEGVIEDQAMSADCDTADERKPYRSSIDKALDKLVRLLIEDAAVITLAPPTGPGGVA
jgi:hypothetical protein